MISPSSTGPSSTGPSPTGPSPTSPLGAPEGLGVLAGQFLARQRWFAGSPEQASAARAAEHAVLLAGEPGLDLFIFDVGGDSYCVPVGARPEAEAQALLAGQERAVLGPLPGGLLAYDALADPELALALLELAGGRGGERVRAAPGEQSNSSVIIDDRLIMKVFRRVGRGRNPDVELSMALDSVGFNHVPAPAGSWSWEGWDLAIVRDFLAGGTEGWSLALTSLRDLCAGGGAVGPAPSTAPSGPALGGARNPLEVAAAAGGDFAPEARRLGEMTARCHLALAEALGTEPGDPAAWADGVAAQLEAAGIASDVAGPLRALEDPGPAVRVHGDYHLGQVMRTDAGWFVLDFEGEPARPLAERARRLSPLKDVAGMLRSLDYAVSFTVRSLGDSSAMQGGQSPPCAALGGAWRDRNQAAFLAGYRRAPGIGALLPGGEEAFGVVLSALVVEKAAYELVYERAYRPDWAAIPAGALESLLGIELPGA